MYAKQALREMGFGGPILTASQREALDHDGFFIVEGVYSATEAREMAEQFDRLIEIEGERGGHEVHIEPGAPRVSDIYNKTDAYDRCLECDVMLGASEYLLDEFKLLGANLR